MLQRPSSTSQQSPHRFNLLLRSDQLRSVATASLVLYGTFSCLGCEFLYVGVSGVTLASIIRYFILLFYVHCLRQLTAGNDQFKIKPRLVLGFGHCAYFVYSLFSFLLFFYSLINYNANNNIC